MRIGIVGLGLLGRAMARRFLDAGYEVCGNDIAPAAREEAAAFGVTVLPEARTVAESADTLVLSLLTSEDRRTLFWGPQNMACSLRRGAIILDTTTARPEDVRVDSKRVAAEQGARLVDVCVSGSSQVVLEGRALALVGDREDRAEYQDLLRTFAAKQYYFGEPGRGNEAKLVVNLVFGLNRLVLAEALGLAAKGGFDLPTMLDVLREGDTYSKVMDAKGPKMVSGSYTPPVARLAQHAKDVHLIAEYAREVGARIPVTELHSGIIDTLVEAGFGSLDNAAIFKAYE
ncbi:MAG: NAD(P)-dependent oxidoreductase [Candidatus Hydrogenedentes bacterium]|nr:NAD(P)-dependent oxidoreductase [Candidatus Hydrogenedentota bacterium]